ncbi:MAG: caspase family protein [Cyclobacteriaceae bacterium]
MKLSLTFLLCLAVALPSIGQVSEGTSNSINLGAVLKKAYEEKESQPKTVVVEQPVAEAEKVEIVLASDVDLNIPKTDIVNEYGIAVIIGNRDYQNTKNVDYAINDAMAMKKYVQQTMGFRDGNIFYVENASKTDFEILFGTKDDYRGQLYNAVRADMSDVFIFYSGHGAPDVNTNTGYFVPVECNPQYINLTGYNSDVLFTNLSKIPAKSVTVAMDACFSGAEILENVSPVGIQSKGFNSVDNGVFISSSAGTQVSSWYTEKEHGMFTYFFLKAIQNRNADADKDGQLTANEIFRFVYEEVPYHARRFRNVDQTPTLQGSKRDQVVVSFEAPIEENTDY